MGRLRRTLGGSSADVPGGIRAPLDKAIFAGRIVSSVGARSPAGSCFERAVLAHGNHPGPTVRLAGPVVVVRGVPIADVHPDSVRPPHASSAEAGMTISGQDLVIAQLL
ncbi:hypothetical protein ACFO9E_21315 [Streptomyces maoxianensis]|uniref:Uncharacterized protein n=1 Tax=Streptomyces maoxianensis TaxID=1459942 RepID=A0ABV9G9X0_9ACTN